MAITPLQHYVVVRLDPDESPSKIIARPDLDTIKFCKRCGNMMEALGETLCHKRVIWEYDRGGVPRAREIDQSHDIDSVQAPANPTITRTGTILICGKDVKEVRVGMRVAFHFASGRTFDEDTPDLRVMNEDAIYAEVVE